VSTTTAPVDTAADTTDTTAYRVAQRLILPADADLDVLPLYIDGKPRKAASRTPLHPEDVVGRHSMRVRAGDRVSFGSYFNAFPASYWKRWTVADHVRLAVTTSGAGTLIVYKSNARGVSQRVDSKPISGKSTTTTLDLTLEPFGDGGWYWFDIVAGDGKVVVESAIWSVKDNGKRGRVSLGLTTMNRADYCVRTIGMVAGDDDLRGILDRMYIVDQGTQKVRVEDGFDEVAGLMGDQLEVIDQANLGGSGGFSRGMYETVKAGQSDYVILLDDDVILETESIIRLATFADMAAKPTIVGGHMFDMNARSVLHSFGEGVDPFYWQWGLATPEQRERHDFSRTGLRAAPEMHQRVDVDYNGWWMCLIPVEVIKQLGLAMPVFIKWDDAEYGLRAREAGIPTVSLPGAALWHVSWLDKDDLVGWQAYFHARNRLITALMYSPFEHGKYMLRTTLASDLKHLVSMQYYTGTGRIRALEDVLAGPHRLHEILPVRLQEIRALAAEFTDAQMVKDVNGFPEVRNRKPVKPRRKKKPDTGPVLVAKGALALARSFAARENPDTPLYPQARIAHKDNKWYRVAKYDSAIVSTADGTAASWYQRDPKRMRALAARSAALNTQVFNRWKKLRDTYRDARAEITSFEAWERTFGLGDGSKSE
jgi:galactofuranosylgalactofuranosylrhamnosyl-N-acetylglucosaminyl-diphospho-decaprenol beta-1,5/1,6-galactofuranosyltransferase